MSDNNQQSRGIGKMLSKQDENLMDECVLAYMDMRGAKDLEGKFRIFVKVSLIQT